jgi:hypothetical protein
MRSVSTTISKLALVGGLAIISLNATAQVNSPFSRYGIGNLISSQHVISSSLGGIQAAYADGFSNNIGQSINFNNPATYSSFYMTSYNLALMLDSRNLKSNNPVGNYKSVNLIPAYVAIGVPLSRTKGLGLAFGLRPISRINYSIINAGRAAGDSVETTYEGSGGLNQAFVGIGKRWKKLSIGFNTGYTFGRKEIGTKISFVNDSVNYFKSNTFSLTNYGKTFLQLGAQYEITIAKKENKNNKSSDNYLLRLGATATLQQSLNATQNLAKETYVLGGAGNYFTVDTVLRTDNVKGTLILPATYEVGAVFHKTNSSNRGVYELWSLGLEYSSTQWTKYRSYNQPDAALNNSWNLKMGVQLNPNALTSTNYLSSVSYRFGVNIGKDYINADGNGLKTSAVTFGAGFPVRKWRAYETQYTVVQTGMQIGKRGSSVNNITENYFQFTLGFSLNDSWFIKRRYD